MGRDEIGDILPLTAMEGWKFARALPPALFADMLLSDHYHVEEFIECIKREPVFLHSEPVRRESSGES
jgi:hypothetical protein